MVDDLYVYGKQGFGSTGSEGKGKGFREGVGSAKEAEKGLTHALCLYV